jgi:ankyrin repeat protein
VEYLAAQRARLEARSNQGFTALLSAAQRGHHAVVRVLEERGADVNVAFTLTHQSALWKAALYGHLATVETLLSLGARVDSQAFNGSTPLLVASQEGRTDCVLALLQAGADATLRQSDGAAALHQAAVRNRAGAVAALLEHGCDPEMVSSCSPAYPPLTLHCCSLTAGTRGRP